MDFIFSECGAIASMRVKDYLLAVSAGFILVLLWYSQFAFGLVHKSDILWELYLYPFFPAICLVFLLKHVHMKYVLIKIGIFLVSSFSFLLLSYRLNLHYRILNAFIPGYGRITAGGSFALMFETLFYLGVNGFAVLLTICFCSLTRKEK